MAISQNFPSISPSLSLNFASSRTLDPRITFTRTSSATCVGPNGLLRVVPANSPRFDHNPETGESLGLLVEEQRTNSITNNTMVGAVAGLPGTSPTGWFLTASANGISPEIVGTGVEDGIDYVDIRYSGTSTSSGNFSILASTITAITAATGQSWTGSAYVKLQAGSLSGITNTLQSVNGRSAAGAGLESTNVLFTPNSDGLGVQRRTVSVTLANASTARISHTIFNGAYSSGVTIDITLRIGMPQLEQGAFATSVIPTTTSTVTRTADVASITGSNFSSWYRQDEGTVFTSFNSPVPTSVSVTAGVNSFDDGTANNRFSPCFYGSNLGQVAANQLISGVTSYTLTGVSGANLASTQRAATALSFGNYGMSVNGLNPVTNSSAVALPTVNTLRFGIRPGGSQANGHIRQLAYWPQRLSNEILQTLTK